MREILFRGKRTFCNEWVYGDLVHYPDRVKIDTHETGQPWRGYDVFPETVGQYTGLNDKNGKMIFEGDIVRHYNRIAVGEPDVYDIGAIYWNMDHFSWARTTNKETTWDYIRLCGDCVYEVIDNIHDIPVLLKKGSYNGCL